jgi:hypothetical protein
MEDRTVLNRRKFLWTSAAACRARKRGWDHVRQFAELPTVEVAALCEVDENVAAGRLRDAHRGHRQPFTIPEHV